MNFELNRLKIENLVGYFKDEVIDLTPPFQRGRVWTLPMRQGLLKNIFESKPIPAIFLYKTQEGAKNVYVILDGKQRLESLLLYIGNQRKELKIPNWHSYVFGADRKAVHFKALVAGKKKGLKQLTDEEAARFRDYSLSIIEIDFDDEVTLAEIIQLFVDINQSGVKVGKFDIVKAVYLKDPLLLQIFDLIAEQEKRGKDTFFRSKRTSFSKVLKKLDVINRADDPQALVDRMWQKLWELALFTATGQHRKPSQILKDFIGKAKDVQPKLTPQQVSLMGNAFKFLAQAYKNSNLGKTRMATDQTHFYILATFLIDEFRQNSVLPGDTVDKLIKFDALRKGEQLKGISTKIREKVSEYNTLSVKQTTDVTKRQQRGKLFKEILESL